MVIIELLESRAKQAEDKKHRLAREKEEEKGQLAAQLQYTLKMDEREALEMKRKADKVVEFRHILQAQIEEIERLRSRQRSGVDGPNIREELICEEERLKVSSSQSLPDHGYSHCLMVCCDLGYS